MLHFDGVFWTYLHIVLIMRCWFGKVSMLTLWCLLHLQKSEVSAWLVQMTQDAVCWKLPRYK